MSADRLREALLLGVGVTAISWGGPLVRLTTAPALTVAAWRMILAALVFLPWGLGGRRGGAGRWALGAGVCLAAHFAFWIQSLRLTSVASSVVLVNTNPLFVGVLSRLLGERPGKTFWGGVLVALLGTALIGLGDFSLSRDALVGDVLALAGAGAASGYLLLGRRAQRERSLLPYVSLVYLVAALLLAPLAWAGGAFLPPRGDWLWLGLIALVPQVLGHTAVNRALRRFPASAVAVAILGEPVGATLWAFLLFREALHPLQGTGILFVLLGILWGLRPGKA